mmetsp:Transcript_135707/g.434089  ORF Transcript_135707/g.434089 Transcript_135707/m.434089 type:complete len:235 (+) Transcript_135707:1683-2387(+)
MPPQPRTSNLELAPRMPHSLCPRPGTSTGQRSLSSRGRWLQAESSARRAQPPNGHGYGNCSSPPRKRTAHHKIPHPLHSHLLVALAVFLSTQAVQTPRAHRSHSLCPRPGTSTGQRNLSSRGRWLQAESSARRAQPPNGHGYGNCSSPPRKRTAHHKIPHPLHSHLLVALAGFLSTQAVQTPRAHRRCQLLARTKCRRKRWDNRCGRSHRTRAFRTWSCRCRRRRSEPSWGTSG